MESAASVETILAHCVFFVDRRSRLSRMELHRWLVELALYQSDRSLTLQEIARSIFTDVLPMKKDAFKPEWAQSVISVLVEEERVERHQRRGQDVFSLSSKRRHQIESAKRAFDVTKKAFEELVLANSKGPLLNKDLSQDDERGIIKALHLTVYHIFLQNAVKFALLTDTLVGKNPLLLDDDTVDKAEDVLSASLDEALGCLDVRVPAIKHAIISTLVSGAPVIQQYLALCHHQILYAHLLGIDPSLQLYQRNLLERRTVFLDTNVVIAMMFRREPRHMVVQRLINDCRRLGINIAVLPWTIEETNRWLDKAKRILHKSPEIALDPVRGASFKRILMEITDSTKNARAIDLDAFFAGFEANLWLKGKDISVFDVEHCAQDPPLAELRAITYRVKDQIAEATGAPSPSPDLVEHDVQCLLAINRLREEENTDPMGPRYWLLTLDTSLKSIERDAIRHHRLYELPCALRVDDLAEELIAYQYPKAASDGCSEYLALLMESHLGTIDLDEGISVEAILATVEAPAIRSSLAAESDGEKLEGQASALARSELSKTLSAEEDQRQQALSEILEAVSAHYRREKANEWRTEYERMLQSKLDSFEEDLARLALEASEKQEQASRTIETLSKDLSHVSQEASVIQRRYIRLIRILIACAIGAPVVLLVVLHIFK